MANLAYQVTNFAYQGSGVFVYQGSVDSGVVQQTPGGGTKLRYTRRKKLRKPDVPQTIVVEVPLVQDAPGTLEQVLKDMEKAGFDFMDKEEEDDALVLTFILKTLQ